MGLFSSKPKPAPPADNGMGRMIKNVHGHMEAATRAYANGDEAKGKFHHQQRKAAEKEARRLGAWWIG